MEEELKPCPCCASEDICMEETYDGCKIHCEDCGIQTMYWYCSSEATDTWNTRLVRVGGADNG